MSDKCNHDWSFDGESCDHKIGFFSCNLCGKHYESEGVPDSFYQPDNILNQLKIEMIRHGHTTTSLVCYEAMQKINLSEETIRTQQATIDRLTEHAKKLITNTMLFDGATLETVTSNFGMDEWLYELKALIAEIEAGE